MNPPPIHVCVLTRRDTFLEHTSRLLTLPGLRRGYASLPDAMRAEHKPDLIFAELGSQSFDDYLAVRETDRRLCAVPLLAFTHPVTEKAKDEATKLGAADVFDLEVMSANVINSRVAHILRAPNNYRPHPAQPYAHAQLNRITLELLRSHESLPSLDAHCRAEGSFASTPIALFVYDNEAEHFAGLYEDVDQALRQYDPNSGTPSHCVDLAAPPTKALIEITTKYAPTPPAALADRYA